MSQLQPEDFERVPCPRCGVREYDPVTSAEPNDVDLQGSFAVVQCHGCGLAYANPRLSGPALSAAYGMLETNLDPTESAGGDVSILTAWWRHVTQRQVVGDWVLDGPVLDVGCAVGELLVTLKARGVDASGIESSPAAVARARARGLDVKQGTIEEVSLADASYRTITMSHVLEHVADPIPVLQKLWRALVPGGRLVVAVPNRGGLTARLFGGYWHGWDPPFHLIHFDGASLRGVLEAAGFRVDRVLTRGNPDDVTRSLRKVLGRRVQPFWLRAALLPGTLALGALAQGGELCAVAQRPTAGN